MGNTGYTIPFGKSPSKKVPHPLQAVNLFPLYHIMVMCSGCFPPFPLSLGGNAGTQAGRDLLPILAGLLCLYEQAAAVMTFSHPFCGFGCSSSFSLIYPLGVVSLLFVSLLLFWLVSPPSSFFLCFQALCSYILLY